MFTFTKVFVLIVAAVILATCTVMYRAPQAFFKSARPGTSLVEVLDEHPHWVRINFGKKLSDAPYAANYGSTDCGSIGKRDGQMVFRSLPDGPTLKESSHSNLRDIFLADPKLFTKCSIVSVTYQMLLAIRGTVDVQVDAQGKIILAREPRIWD